MILALLLAAYAPTEAKNAATITQGPGRDGGTAWGVYVQGAAAGTTGVTNSELRASPINVLVDGGSITVANFPATQPVSGTLTCNAGTGTMGVSGTVNAQINDWQGDKLDGITTSPSGSEVGLVVRNIPSGTQTVSGSVTATVASTTITGNVAVTQAASSITGQNPCINPTATLQMVAGSTSGTASVQLVALSGSTRIYVCSMMIIGTSGTSPTFSLTYGTGSACATGNNVIIGAFTTTANALFNFGGGLLAATPAGQALCYVQTGTTPISRYVITYVQQ